jgi:hypothetical protein
VRNDALSSYFVSYIISVCSLTVISVIYAFDLSS